jgi:hypothetical protein
VRVANVELEFAINEFPDKLYEIRHLICVVATREFMQEHFQAFR